MKTKILLLGLLVVAGCSSPTERSYQINDLELASIDYTRLADRKRQQESYSDALELYLRAEQYALQRNNQRKIGISKLKRALIHIVLDQNQNAETLISEVTQANQIERLGLTQAIAFSNAKLLLNKGEKRRAFVLLSELERYYQSDPERQAYYLLMRWSHDYQQLPPGSVQLVIERLTETFEAKSLNNIEILSFAYFEHARWAVNNASLEQGQVIIERSIEYFSMLELTPKIAKSVKFAADFYDRHGLTAKSDYYLGTYQRLVSGN